MDFFLKVIDSIFCDDWKAVFHYSILLWCSFILPQTIVLLSALDEFYWKEIFQKEDPFLVAETKHQKYFKKADLFLVHLTDSSP